MATVHIRIELPSYSHSFVIQVGDGANISAVKEAISASCVGGPRPEGQRVIWRGRVLGDDEYIDNLWKGADEPRILHLSVHPSAWTQSPPGTQPGISEPLSTLHTMQNVSTPYWQPLGTPYSTAGSPFLTPQPPHPAVADYFGGALPPTMSVNTDANPLLYVLFRHNNALLEVMQCPPVPDHPPHIMDAAHRKAITTVNHFGWDWPSFLDEPYPASVSGGIGAKYERTTVNGQEYLALTNPDSTPTARQTHALQVLAYTFPLLSLTLPNVNAVTNIRSTRGHEENFHPAMLPDLNAHLEQLGVAPVRVRNDLLLRPLLFPLVMLAFRAVILLYVFSPARKPVLALAIGAWVMYEVWKVIAAAIVPAARAGAQAAAAAAAPQPPAVQDGGVAPAAALAGPAANHGQAAPPAVAGAAVRGPGRAAALGGNRRPQPDLPLQAMSQINLPAEERALRARPEDSGNDAINAPPSTAHRVKSFVTLFAMTLHPAVWDYRRATLSKREGQIRTEANAMELREEALDAEENLPEELRAQRREEAETRRRARDELLAQHARRARWVKDYVERVKVGDWADHAA